MTHNARSEPDFHSHHHQCMRPCMLYFSIFTVALLWQAFNVVVSFHYIDFIKTNQSVFLIADLV